MPVSPEEQRWAGSGLDVSGRTHGPIRSSLCPRGSSQGRPTGNPLQHSGLFRHREHEAGLPLRDFPLDVQTHLGWATASANRNLGTCAHGFGFGGTGKKSNSKQFDDGGEILYNCLGLRYGDNGVFVPESDHSIAPPPDQSTELLWISYMLSKAVYGYVMKNEDNDIDPAFPELLEKRRSDFARLDFDIETIQSRTNI